MTSLLHPLLHRNFLTLPPVASNHRHPAALYSCLIISSLALVALQCCLIRRKRFVVLSLSMASVAMLIPLLLMYLPAMNQSCYTFTVLCFL